MRELGILSKKLATIFIDCDVTLMPRIMKLTCTMVIKVQEIFEELEFRRLKDQILKLCSRGSDEGSKK